MSVRVFFSGDVVNTSANEQFVSEELQCIIRDQDYSVCNFEATIDGFGKKIPKVGPHISQKLETIKYLKEAGFNLLLLANNHIYDYGEVGLAATINEIKKLDLEFVGAGLDYNIVYKAHFKEIKGIKIAFLNASEAQFGVLDDTDVNQNSGYAWINHYFFDELVISSKKNADVVIVCAHAGLEDYPIPMIDWRRRYKRLCDLGADCIIGSHPHVPQGFEIYNKKPIFYSLGNFYFDTLSFKNKPDHTYSVILDINKNNIGFNFVYHHKIMGIVQLSNRSELPFNFSDLNNDLDNNEKQIEMYSDCYKKVTKPYFADAHNSILMSDKLILMLKKIVLKILPLGNYKRRRELLLLHLLRNETYRWITVKDINMRNKI